MAPEGPGTMDAQAVPGAQHRAGAHWAHGMNGKWHGPAGACVGRAHLLLHQGVAGRALLASCTAGREEKVVLAAVTLVAHEARPAHARAVLAALG